MHKKPFLTLLLAGLFLPLSIALTSCDKEDDDHGHVSDTDKPAITITSPTEMQIYYSGDTVKIHGTVTDANLHELMIKITKDSDGSVLFSETPVVHDLTSYTINTFWKSQVSGHTNARLIVLAEDHSSNVSSDTVRIHIMP